MSWRHAWRTSSEIGPPDQSAAALDPSTAATSQEFVELLRSLKDESGLTHRQLVAKAEANGDVLPLATLASALTRATLPRAALVSAFTRAAGCGPDEVDRWLAARDQLATAGRSPATHQVHGPPAADPSGGGQSATPDRRRRHRSRTAGVLLLACFLLALLTASGVDQPPAPCPTTLRMGDVGACVEDAQSWLVRAGLQLPVDGVYGPYTKMKVGVFQLYKGIPSTGVADERTLHALRADRARIDVWPADRVERRLREVFPEEPDRVVDLVRCLSILDPHWVIRDDDGARTWGLFQLTDGEVILEHRGGYLTALDPEWNIQTARAIRDRTGGLGRWTCTTPIR
ncbi:peptidoglycan-binding domain-containing protein [Actinophytocola sediminis]